jgi:HAD superfamily hydrolase (TIGR01509 family)
MSAILFGSISTVADTSEVQRQAFNRAFAEHGVNWSWDRDDYIAMLGASGGRSRIAAYADSVGTTVDAAAIHETKSRIFRESLAGGQVSPRPGVVDTVQEAKDAGAKVGLVTTTSADNIAALLAALGPAVGPDSFDVIISSSDVDLPKPDGAAYAFALKRLGEQPNGCVAVEDNIEGAQAAAAAGVPCVAFPNENTAGQDFAAAQRRVDRLSFEDLGGSILEK